MTWVVLIPLLPALAFAGLAPMSRHVRNAALWVSLAAMTGSLLLSIAVFARAWPGGERPVWQAVWTLADIGGKPLEVGLRVDAVTAVMLLVITIVGICVQVYSLSYMHSDARRGWYFAVISLFTAAMLLLVLAGDYLLLYMSWEVMGLCSYLLIGFWHDEEAPRLASIKAFLTTRVGDVGFVIGLAIMFATVGSFGFERVDAFNWSPVALAAAATSLLIFFGAMGKSAQVPLHVWLPDAMAGPTPASALIHAATMVAAGVYLVIRAMPIFVAAGSGGLRVVLWIGLVTALVGGLLAVVQHDIKKILAYSTISQLGFMFVALGAGSVTAALFHLVTHAFFKSLLFLGAGVIIHSTHTQDIREMGGVRKAMPVTTVAFTIGALALAGLPALSGFFSKDEILVALNQSGLYAPSERWLVIGLLLFAAALTAFYVTRLWFRVFGGAAECHAHEGHPAMLGPMIVLASITVLIGWTQPVFMEFLGERGAWPDPLMAGLSAAVFVVGAGLGWLVYGRRVIATDPLKARFPAAYGILRNKLYFDAAYDAMFVRPYRRAAAWLARFDLSTVDGVVNAVAAAWTALSSEAYRTDTGFIDGGVDGTAVLVRRAGARMREIQVGRVQVYQRLAFAGLLLALVLVLLLVLILRGA